MQWFIRNRDERVSGIWLYKQFTDLFTLQKGKNGLQNYTIKRKVHLPGNVGSRRFFRLVNRFRQADLGSTMKSK